MLSVVLVIRSPAWYAPESSMTRMHTSPPPARRFFFLFAFWLQVNDFVQEKSDWHLLGLIKTHQTYVKALGIPAPPTGKSEVDMVADYLSKLRDAIWSALHSLFEMEEIHIRWWFAIPPVWDGIGQVPLHASALQAGLIRGDHDDEIFFVTEPVAYLLRCCKTLLFDPKPSDAFLVVVAGKATVEAVCYEAVRGHPLGLKQLTAPSGDSCG